VKEIDFEIGHIHNFQTSVTLTTIGSYGTLSCINSFTYIYIPNFVEIGKTFSGRMDIESGFEIENFLFLPGI